MPIFLLNNKVLYFIHIPKTGGSSVEAALRQLGARQALLHGSKGDFMKCTPQHMHAALAEKFVPASFRDYSFAISRHPVNRLVSEFHMRRGRWKTSITFDDFVEYAFTKYQENRYIFDNHIRPQAEFLTSDAKEFRFEEGLDKVMEDVCTFAGVNFSLKVPHKRKKVAEQPSISEATLKKIWQFYTVDFERFGYR